MQETITLIVVLKWIYLQVRFKYFFGLGIKAYRGPPLADNLMRNVVEEFLYVALPDEE